MTSTQLKLKLKITNTGKKPFLAMFTRPICRPLFSFFHELPHSVLGPVRVLAPPVTMDGAGFQPGAPPPAFGSATRAILGEIGFDAAAIDALVAAKVTRAS